ncbi:Fe(3+)-hydroxamate ABC transporter permease FhuB [Paenibacillus glycanilyticus]|uniref:Fe(3+)-hydroxamate ABC transporter permease FhuB n=1 Tax=Paenibacillus glycanilyticus TaxID=126569 RepID=UPI00203DD246|nr:Fe(3+)-hydroxamate ABC transporter permease FhuB [Paenibacillus glycanilyticus]MCM3628057.1 Fe(3+)-hydroxamate ABC transporter permease FhuB [Paenibacillus glycanilyticus]
MNTNLQTTKETSKGNWSPLLLSAAGLLLLVALASYHLTLGEATMPVETVWRAIFEATPVLEHQILWTVRLPRTVIGILTGGALAVAGALFQNVTRNPLASAGTLGINAGAFLALTAGTIMFPGLAMGFPLLLTFIGAIAAAGAAFVMAGGTKASPVRLALSGMIVTMTAAAFTGVLQLFNEQKTQGLFMWGSGSLVQNDWNGVQHAWPWIIGCFLLAFLLAGKWDLMELDEDTVTSLGQKVGRIRLTGLAIGVLLAAAAVSVVGPIGFVGLIAPHLMRMLGAKRHVALLPLSFLWGAIIVIGSDAIAMHFKHSLGPLPAGAVTALIGGPWLAYLVLRTVKTRKEGTPQTGSSPGRAASKVSFGWWLPIFSLLLAGSLIVSLAFGSLRIPVADVIHALFGHGADSTQRIVEMRIPRTLVAALAGATLAVSGLLLQGVVRNPLADPSIIGVTGGASVGAMLMLAVFTQVSVQWLPAGAFIGAVAAAVIVFVLGRKSSFNPAVVALIGLAVSSMASAIVQVLVIRMKLTLASALVWLSGTTYARNWGDFWQLVFWPIVLLPVAWYLARKVDVLQFSDATVTNLGLRVDRTRLVIGGVGVAMAAAAVATVGSIGFIGLIAPHMTRMLVGPKYRKLVPLTALLGALLLVLADTIGRSLLAPKELPSGLVAAVVGAPYFMWLMYRSGKK